MIRTGMLLWNCVRLRSESCPTSLCELRRTSSDSLPVLATCLLDRHSTAQRYDGWLLRYAELGLGVPRFLQNCCLQIALK